MRCLSVSFKVKKPYNQTTKVSEAVKTSLGFYQIMKTDNYTTDVEELSCPSLTEKGNYNTAMRQFYLVYRQNKVKNRKSIESHR